MMTNQEDTDEKSIFDLQGLKEIKKRPDILSGIKLHVTPRMVMEPRFHAKPEDLHKLNEIAGYLFYIESQCSPPALMLMKVGKTDITNTIGKIDEIPQDIIGRAMENPPEPPSHGMFPINDEIRAWLKKELGI
jgi:hypothetical protein